MDRLSELEAFVQVVNQGGFSEAARKLGLSKSAVSKHVSALEQRLGVRLLNRTTRRVSPTEIGSAFFDRASAVLSSAAEAEAMVTAMQEAPRGVLKVSAPIHLGNCGLSQVISGFLIDHPDISIDLGLEDRFVDLVSEGFDVAVRIGQLSDSSLMARKLGESRMRIVASPDYIKAHGAPDTLEDLARHKLLAYSIGKTGSQWRIRTADGEDRVFRASGQMIANNGSALLTASEAGLGIVCLPGFILAEALEANRVEPLLPDVALDSLGIFAVYPAGRFMQPKLRVFIDHLIRAFRNQQVSL